MFLELFQCSVVLVSCYRKPTFDGSHGLLLPHQHPTLNHKGVSLFRLITTANFHVDYAAASLSCTVDGYHTAFQCSAGVQVTQLLPICVALFTVALGHSKH
jgi:hypothetical protein